MPGFPAAITKAALDLGRKMGLDKKAAKNGPPAGGGATEGPPPCMEMGTRVKVTRGDIPQLRKDDAIVGERRADGVMGRIDGAAYVSNGGAHKGELIQPIREDGTGAVLGVPTSLLERARGGGGGRPRAGYSPTFASAYEAAFGKDHKASTKGWREVSPGRWVKDKE